MALLLIIADDFTGALDTGVQFAANGIRTKVVVDPQVDFSAMEDTVLVVDTETRHVDAQRAGEVVFDLARRACEAGISYIYKKTDSALRGNVGAELAAVLRATGARQLPFLPAFPQMGRVTVGGVHYVDGVPVTQSPFGIDPFEPVRHSVVSELIAQQCDLPAGSFAVPQSERDLPKAEGILVFDAETEADLARTGELLMGRGMLRAMAGCAGFGAVLPRLLGMECRKEAGLPELDPRLLVVCGSVNPITVAQLDSAQAHGFARVRLTLPQKLDAGYWQSADGARDLAQIEQIISENPYCIIDSNDLGGNAPTAEYAQKLGMDMEAVRVGISSSLGHLVGALFARPCIGTLMLTGGDTLLRCMNCVGVSELEPVCELDRGVVLARFALNGCTRHVITKSGGFGAENLLIELAERIGADK